MIRSLIPLCATAIGMMQVALAVPEVYHLRVTTEGEGIYTTQAVQIAPGTLVALIPNRLTKGNDATYILPDHPDAAPTVCVREEMTGATLFTVRKGSLPKPTLIEPGSTALHRGDKLIIATPTKETTQGVYIGMEHSIGSTGFPLSLIRAQFPKLASPEIGSPCYNSDNQLIGIVLGKTDKGTCHLLPAQAVYFLKSHPKARRVRLGCLLDINATTPIIEGLINGGPLARAGIQTGDIFVSINGSPIDRYADMLNITYYLTGEAPLNIKVLRGTQIISFDDIHPTTDER